ncbi:hypothetical protein CCMA1212_004866 [Trichoderma ghanense]|uniref:Uncharacterized protein n=1 Tax=Trichoderma ghanense TaxID=65468 RepID=A0ABY2H593_9HYPO
MRSHAATTACLRSPFVRGRRLGPCSKQWQRREREVLATGRLRSRFMAAVGRCANSSFSSVHCATKVSWAFCPRLLPESGLLPVLSVPLPVRPPFAVNFPITPISALVYFCPPQPAPLAHPDPLFPRAYVSVSASTVKHDSPVEQNLDIETHVAWLQTGTHTPLARERLPTRPPLAEPPIDATTRRRGIRACYRARFRRAQLKAEHPSRALTTPFLSPHLVSAAVALYRAISPFDIGLVEHAAAVLPGYVHKILEACSPQCLCFCAASIVCPNQGKWALGHCSLRLAWIQRNQQHQSSWGTSHAPGGVWAAEFAHRVHRVRGRRATHGTASLTLGERETPPYRHCTLGYLQLHSAHQGTQVLRFGGAAPRRRRRPRPLPLALPLPRDTPSTSDCATSALPKLTSQHPAALWAQLPDLTYRRLLPTLP